MCVCVDATLTQKQCKLYVLSKTNFFIEQKLGRGVISLLSGIFECDSAIFSPMQSLGRILLT